MPIAAIIEDDTDLREALVRAFTDGGFEVTSAGDGVAGATAILNSKPNIILLDLLMPQQSGIEMMAALEAQNAWVAKVPVIILTNYDLGDKHVHDVLAHRPMWYLMKSDWTLSDIVAKARHLLNLPTPEEKA